MKRKHFTRSVASPDDIRQNFDRQAIEYAEQHGDADELLAYRLGLFREKGDLNEGCVVLDIGCGNGHHLRGLRHWMNKGIGIDFSQGMVEVAQRHSQGMNLEFFQDNATKLDRIEDASVDRVICSGAFEHMVDQTLVLTQVYRVLRPGGRFVCLTPNGNFVWYNRIAPLLGWDTQHYATDRFMRSRELEEMASGVGFTRVEVDYWTFIPRGDMPKGLPGVLERGERWWGPSWPERWRSGLRLVTIR